MMCWKGICFNFWSVTTCSREMHFYCFCGAAVWTRNKTLNMFFVIIVIFKFNQRLDNKLQDAKLEYILVFYLRRFVLEKWIFQEFGWWHLDQLYVSIYVSCYNRRSGVSQVAQIRWTNCIVIEFRSFLFVLVLVSIAVLWFPLIYQVTPIAVLAIKGMSITLK